MSEVGTSRTSLDVRLESAMWGKADIDQIAVVNCDFVITHPKALLLPSRTHIDVRLSNPFLKTRHWTHWPDGSVLSLLFGNCPSTPQH